MSPDYVQRDFVDFVDEIMEEACPPQTVVVFAIIIANIRRFADTMFAKRVWNKVRTFDRFASVRFRLKDAAGTSFYVVKQGEGTLSRYQLVMAFRASVAAARTSRSSQRAVSRLG